MKTSTKLKLFGSLLLAIGITLIILGTVVFKEEMSKDFYFPNFFFLIPGMFVSFLSLPLLFLGFAPNISAAGAKLQNEAYDKAGGDMKTAARKGAEITGEAVEITARATKKGFTGGVMFCKKCGKEIDENSNFCRFCGGNQN